MDDEGLGHRLEMLIVMRWLDEGADARGEVGVPVAAAARDLGLDDDRAGLLAVMSALGSLEERGAVSVTWPSGAASGEALVTIADDVRGDARRLFGRPG